MTTPIGRQPALAFPWTKPGKERAALIQFLAIAERCGHDVAALVDLIDKTRADLSLYEATGRRREDI